MERKHDGNTIPSGIVENVCAGTQVRWKYEPARMIIGFAALGDWRLVALLTRSRQNFAPVPNGRQIGRQNVNYERRGRSSVGPIGTPKRQL